MAKFEYKDMRTLDYYEKIEYRKDLYKYKQKIYAYFYLFGIFIFVFLYSLITN